MRRPQEKSPLAVAPILPSQHVPGRWVSLRRPSKPQHSRRHHPRSTNPKQAHRLHAVRSRRTEEALRLAVPRALRERVKTVPIGVHIEDYSHYPISRPPTGSYNQEGNEMKSTLTGPISGRSYHWDGDPSAKIDSIKKQRSKPFSTQFMLRTGREYGAPAVCHLWRIRLGRSKQGPPPK